MDIGKIHQGKHLAPFALLGAAPGACQVCGRPHPKELPHDQRSLFYQYNFYNEHGRWPTWKDAMEHCSEEMKEAWTQALEEKGIDING